MPRKGAFARCVESVESRGGVSDPRAVCASSIARKRGRTRGRVNVAFGDRLQIRAGIDGKTVVEDTDGRQVAVVRIRDGKIVKVISGKLTASQTEDVEDRFRGNPLFGSSVTYSPTANKKAFSAGKSSGDTGLFDKWYKKSGYEKKGYDQGPLEREYERGVNAGIDEIAERRAKKASATVAKVARRVEAGDVAQLEKLVAGGMTLRQAADSLGIKLNPKPSKAEKTLLETAGRLALLGGGGVPAVLLAGNRGRANVKRPIGVWPQPWEIDGAITKRAEAMARSKGSFTRAKSDAAASALIDRLFGKHAVLESGKRAEIKDLLWNTYHSYDRRNPGTDAADAAYREFHGRDADELVTFETQHHYPKHTAAIGDLIELTIRVPKERGLQDRYITLSDFGEAWLTRHPRMKQLYTEGGDQSVDLGQFGLDSRDPHETEYLGELVRCVYFTRKDHLGKDGGIANYHHKFGKNELTLDKTELIKVGYHVPDEQLLFVGGGYEIPAEGIDG